MTTTEGTTPGSPDWAKPGSRLAAIATIAAVHRSDEDAVAALLPDDLGEAWGLALAACCIALTLATGYSKATGTTAPDVLGAMRRTTVAAA